LKYRQIPKKKPQKATTYKNAHFLREKLYGGSKDYKKVSQGGEKGSLT